jgi:segregation and condensation protein A
MASALIEIKSRQLLPNEESEASSEGSIEDDPLKNLQDRLIEYDKFKNAAFYLSKRPQLGQDIHTNHEWQRLLPELCPRGGAFKRQT